jgi:hypothetical protein
MIQAMMYFSSIAAILTLSKQKLNMVHSFHHHLAEEYGYLERQLIFPFTAINQHDKLELPQEEFEDQHRTSSESTKSTLKSYCYLVCPFKQYVSVHKASWFPFLHLTVLF